MLNKHEVSACKKILKNDKINAKFIIDNETLLSLTSFDSFTLNGNNVEIRSGHAIYNANSTPLALNYQRAIPEKPSGEATNFDTKYLIIIYELVKSENRTGYFKIQYNGNNPARVDINDNCFAILAPLKL